MNLGVAGFVYLILAMQVRMGFPPLYRRFMSVPLIPDPSSCDSIELERVLKLVLPIIFIMIGVMVPFLFIQWPGFFTIMGCFAVWGALRLRQDLLRTIGHPLPWLENKWTLKWPMLVFDAWTITLSLGLLMFLMRQTFGSGS